METTEDFDKLIFQSDKTMKGVCMFRHNTQSIAQSYPQN